MTPANQQTITHGNARAWARATSMRALFRVIFASRSLGPRTHTPSYRSRLLPRHAAFKKRGPSEEEAVSTDNAPNAPFLRPSTRRSTASRITSVRPARPARRPCRARLRVDAPHILPKKESPTRSKYPWRGCWRMVRCARIYKRFVTG